MAADAKKNDYPTAITSALIGSCTNSSYEDLGRAAHLAKQARAHGIKAKVPFLVTPGSEQVRATIQRDGILDDLESIGATVLANACGPCIGQWSRSDIKPGERNSIVTSFNRNFQKRNDGNASTLAFIGSPELVTAIALSGNLSFDPTKDTLTAKDGKQIHLDPPVADELPSRGFDAGEEGFLPPPTGNSKVNIKIDPDSDRLALLEAFPAWDGKDILKARVLLKALGKCTTDHISAAGPWLRYRGHLDRISDNMYIGATNTFTGEVGKGTNVLTGDTGKPFPELARAYQAHNVPWIVVGDHNFGEGSSREHAAMSPRHLGCKAIVVKSFARIHETNLKKQGILPLTFIKESDFDAVREDDEVDIIDLKNLTPGQPVTMVLKHGDGTSETLKLKQTMTEEQIKWFRAGSALNALRNG
jgi:aconitate hydratase